ncbi:MAG: tRNA uridine-5-carboxymethylaminomethyl(34) synthesis GTPase MnmE [Clostridia bacterium]
MSDTIVAISTSLATSAGVNIVRISGEDSFAIAKQIFTSKNLTESVISNYMYLGTIKGELFKEKAFCVFYKAPKSYTGEDVVEIQCHGGKGIANAIVRLVRENGARPAQAGEFTKRAFLNDKLTLQEAEGVLEMINATTESEINNAYRLLSGEVSKSINMLEDLLIKTVAMLEVKMDYPEELEEQTKPIAYKNIENAINILSEKLAASKLAKNMKDGVNIAIVGVPNAGKSSLLNTLIKQDRAIVTEFAGTTRDVVSESIEMEGIRLNFLDTAGIRDDDVNKIESIGIERSKQVILGADIVINVKDSSIQNEIEERKIDKLLVGKKVIVISNKNDIKKVDKEGIKISVITGENINLLDKKIMELAGKQNLYSQPIITNERQIFALQSCYQNLIEAKNNYEIMPSECVVLDIKSALNNLCEITGKEATESVIEQVFSAFCVGK